MSTVGIFNTSNYARHEIAPSLLSTVHRKAPRGLAPFAGMLSRTAAATTTSTTIKWFDKRWRLPKLHLTSDLGAAASGQIEQVLVTNSDWLIEKEVYQIQETQEQVLIVSVVGNTVAIRRGMGDIPGIATSSGAPVAFNVGTAFEESSMNPLPRHTSSGSALNITQIFRNSWGVSGTTNAVSPAIGEARPSANKKEMFMDHTIQQEQAFIFGQMFETVQQGQPLRKMDGMLAMIRKYAPQNIKVAGKTTDFNQLEEMTRSWFEVVTDDSELNDRVLFVDRRAKKVFNDLGRMYYDVVAQPSQTSFGMEFTTFRTQDGTFQIVEHPLFNLMGLNGFAAAFDLSPIKRHYLPGRNAAYEDTFKAGGIDAVGGTVLTEMTISNEAVESSGYIMGLCQAAKTPTVSPVTVRMACLSIDFPCVAGKVPAGTQVKISITGAKPSTAYSIQGPSGALSLTTDATGNKTSSAITLSASDTTYTWSVTQTDSGETLWTSSVVQACTDSPCNDNQPGVNDAMIIDAPLEANEPAGSNTEAWDGYTQGNVPQTQPTP